MEGITVSFAVGLGIGAIAYTLGSLLIDILKGRRKKKYERIFDDWFGKGNRILKTNHMAFIFTYDGVGAVSGVGYDDNKNYFEFILVWIWVMGRVISKKRSPFLLSRGLENIMKPIPKKEFLRELINSDAIFHNLEIPDSNVGRSIFSFDTVDMSLLPDWITMELVAKKLEES